MSFYGTAVGFTSYTEARGKTVLAAWDTAVVEKALLVASEWLDNSFDTVWSGYATDGFTQARKWPRTTAVTNTFPEHVFATNDIPDNVVSAAYEAAFRDLTELGSLTKDFTQSNYLKVSVSGAMSVDYDNSMRASDTQVQMPIIESLMEPLFDESSQGFFASISGAISRV